MTPQHHNYLSKISKYIPKDRIYTDPLRTLCWGTDAGFYRLTPQIVVRALDEAEMSRLLSDASGLNIPVTFRAAGTSLSGQAISDSVLIVAGKNWEKYSVSPDASTIVLQPGIIGARVNEILAPYGRMFAPDPASKGSAMVGGIVINNASGMNCGTHANSDKILLSMRIVLADGTVIDTARPGNSPSEKRLVEEIKAIRDEICADPDLVELIKYKYSIKNVTGLNLEPFVRYSDPYDIIAHSMVGSEGTLGFMSEATMQTSHLYPYSASAMVYFTSLKEACEAVVALKPHKAVYSCELLDKKSLASVHDTTGTDLTALLIETRADSEDELRTNSEIIEGVLTDFSLYKPVEFTSDPEKVKAMWQMRSGVFPAVGGTRPAGTTALIEDVAFHIQDLPEATVELADLLEKCGYDDACIYGHALEGNYHFVIAQSFDREQEVMRYAGLMTEIERLVADKYHGSLKAEHGTGRNMAPFVKAEWGEKAFAMMQRIKHAFDPQNILNPGVIFNDDPECYIKNFKRMPLFNDKVDRCIECGFCEVNCVSCGLTLSARQRIVAMREITRLQATSLDPEKEKELRKEFRYYGNETCAGDGLCSTSCPMKINTGEMIHDLREADLPPGSTGYKVAEWTGKHFAGTAAMIRPVLYLANVAHHLLGDRATASLGRGLHKLGLPLWTPSLPGTNSVKPAAGTLPTAKRKVVYFPSCFNRTMGASSTFGEKEPPLTDVMVQLCHKAGFEVVYPDKMDALCCGLIWESKGVPEVADSKSQQLYEELMRVSDGGKIPVVFDQSPCIHRMREYLKSKSSLHIYEPSEFVLEYLADHLIFTPESTPVAVHITCSTRRMGLADKIMKLARMCSTSVYEPQEVGCCGFAGDKGFTHPELNAWGLRKLRPQIVAHAITEGFSNSRTCEIGLTTNSGINYKSILYLVNRTTKPK